MLLVIARWLLTMFARELLLEYGWQIVSTLLLALVLLVVTVLWALSIIAQPAGIYWLAAQAPREVQAQHPLAPIVIPAPLNPSQPPVIGAAEAMSVHGGGRQWTDGPAYNQFARSSWRAVGMFTAWAPAACSAASLAWMLRAYGQPLSALDDAIALENPPIGISTQQGLMDHTGTQLAVALAHQGLSGFKKHFASTQDLVTGLRDGPLMMDGQRWFGVGHWFVATGADSSGIAIRESSGNDIRRLTWEQLYGPVGWSGWAVGVLP